MAFVQQRPEGVLIRVRAQPRASRTEAAGAVEGRLKLRISAPPVEGAANEAALKWLAKTLGVAKSAVSLERGRRSREKDFLVRDVSAGKVEAALLGGGAKSSSAKEKGDRR
jgi:uncharacterized protein (TIGR00251 family)